MALKIVSGIEVTSIALSSFLDLQKQELRNAQIQNLSTTQINAITSPAQGQFVYDSTLDLLKVYDGAAWQLVGAAADGSSIELSSNTLSIKAGGVSTSALAALAVTTAKIAADAITGAKIADNAIDSEHYTDGSIDTAHIGNAQVTGAKIAATTVATGNIVNLAVTSGKLAEGAVGTAKLATDAVTTAKIADAQITTALIATDAVTAAKIADNSIDVARLNTSDGSNGQFLKTNGSGTLSFATPVDDSVSAINLTATLAALDTTHTQNVDSTDVVKIGSSTNTPNIQVTGDVIVDGDLTVGGTTTTINSTTVTIDDPVFTLGGDTAPSSDDNKDRGIEFRYHNGTSAKLGFFGYDDSERKLVFIADATNTSEVFTGALGDAKFGSFEAGTIDATANFLIGGTAVTSTAAELNILDGVTASTAELNIMDGVTATATELNIMDGVTATTTELNYVDGVTSAIQTQLNSKPAAYAAAVTTSSGTATIAQSAHGLGFPVNVQVYDENGQLVLADIRQTVSGGDMTITINAPDATYDVIAVGAVQA